MARIEEEREEEALERARTQEEAVLHVASSRLG